MWDDGPVKVIASPTRLPAVPPKRAALPRSNERSGRWSVDDTGARKAWSHERSQTGKYEWLTPPEIIHALGRFDLDPCAPIHRPWPTADFHYTVLDDGLTQPRFGRVWLNPPYGPHTHKWLARLAAHGNGIALTFARTETRMFFAWVWGKAVAVLFLRGRLTFYNADGTKPGNSGGAPSCLVAYGSSNVETLARSRLDGKLIRL